MKLSTLEAIFQALNQAGSRYLVVGGLAVAAHGYGRLTFDLDLVVQLRRDNLLSALQALAALDYKPQLPVRVEDFSDAATREAWIRDKHMVVFQLYSERHRETQIDLFVTEPFDFDVEYANAKIWELVPGQPVRFVRLETLIEMKESAGRAKDLEDLRQLRLLLECEDDG
jgi:hypothetical protein